MEQVARLLVTLLSLPPSGGINYVRIFVRYLLATQEPEAAQASREVLQRTAPEVGDDLMTTYAQELLAEGREEGRTEGEVRGKIRTQVEVIENLLRLGEEWSRIEAITGVNETQFQALKKQVADMTDSG